MRFFLYSFIQGASQMSKVLGGLFNELGRLILQFHLTLRFLKNVNQDGLSMSMRFSLLIQGSSQMSNSPVWSVSMRRQGWSFTSFSFTQGFSNSKTDRTGTPTDQEESSERPGTSMASDEIHETQSTSSALLQKTSFNPAKSVRDRGPL